jgi:hypothetical protein
MTMAHFAEVDENNIVTQVLVVPDEQEHRGQEFLADDLSLGGKWIQTSYSNKIRKHYAGIGYSYDEVADVFIAPQPFPSWTLDSNHDWQAPVPYPTDELMYNWDEEAQDWVAVNFE